MNTDFTVTSVFHMIIPHYIKWQLKQRCEAENHGYESSFNTSLMLNLAALNENLIQEFLMLYLNDVSRQKQYDYNFAQQFEREVRNGKWEKYKDKFKDLAGKGLHEIINQKIVEGQTNLFTIRNQIIHGNNIETKYSEKGRLIEQKKYKNVFDFLLKNDAISSLKPDGRDLLKNEVFDFFLKNSQLFFLELSNLLSDSNKRLFRARIKYLLLLNGFSET